ncbi:Transcriptional regulator PadR-like family protein [uncultured archaeon]|nr:Transcriptional regulator PadR-like family protein [uncultured archaeon]
MHGKHCSMGGIPTSQLHRAPIMTLFFLWRLHGNPQHGYSLMQDMKQIAVKPCKPSTVYVLLSKLEKAGYVKSHYDESGARVRRLYSTTPSGWALLQHIKKRKMKGLWREFVKELLA